MSTNDIGRREVLRRKQSEHRRKIKAERAALVREIDALQDLLRSLPPSSSAVSADGTLSWHTIADVFRSGSRQSMATLEKTQHEKHATDVMIFEMVRFVRACRPRPALALSSAFSVVPGNDTFVTLLSNGESRNKAKQWLTQQLYHNTDRAFGSFPTVFDPQEDFFHYTLRFNGSHVQGTEAFQIMYNAPLKTVLAAQQMKVHWKRPIVPPLPELDVEVAGNTTLFRDMTNRTDNYWNLLEGVFHEADRCVVVFRRIQDDETYKSKECFEHYALQWMDMRRVGITQTLVRYLSVRSIHHPPEAVLRSLRESSLDARPPCDQWVSTVMASDFVQNSSPERYQEACQAFDEEREQMHQVLATLT
ncbi:Aste57867_12369 [Aphanomyces stellatus]|uniref:Aste57867_12369 protein n=1 Tax=Aphanomyces stellatus TaxID=120398 RepID=A0A485KVF1_9STRA|nr:hypothetical protein As57867_012323 [Aphanomyces stellatus]VFT89221.1 Aste57867_12369 [Aphanomyces stellatus]